MILSWELFTKHVIRASAEEGALNLLVLIGKELENILSMERLTEAVTPTTSAAGPSSLPRCKIEPIPAPNAWSESNTCLRLRFSLPSSALSMATDSMHFDSYDLQSQGGICPGTVASLN